MHVSKGSSISFSFNNPLPYSMFSSTPVESFLTTGHSGFKRVCLLKVLQGWLWLLPVTCVSYTASGNYPTRGYHRTPAPADWAPKSIPARILPNLALLRWATPNMIAGPFQLALTLFQGEGSSPLRVEEIQLAF